MRLIRNGSRGYWRRAAIVASLVFGTLVAPLAPTAPARAECGLSNRWPSFADVAPDSYAVFTGTVERIVRRWRGYPATFVVRVQRVIKGDVLRRITLSDVYTQGGCVPSWLDVARGDRIAVALGGPSNVRGPVGAVAYLSPIPPDSEVAGAGMERLTMRQVRDASKDRPFDDSLGARFLESVTSSARSLVLLIELVQDWQIRQIDPDANDVPLPVP